MVLEKNNFACYIAHKQIELYEGSSPLAAFFLLSFLVMDPSDCKYMEWKSWGKECLIFHITLYFQHFVDSTALMIFLSFVPLSAQGKKEGEKLNLKLVRQHIIGATRAGFRVRQNKETNANTQIEARMANHWFS